MCLCGLEEDKETERISRPVFATVVASGCLSYTVEENRVDLFVKLMYLQICSTKLQLILRKRSTFKPPLSYFR